MERSAGAINVTLSAMGINQPLNVEVFPKSYSLQHDKDHKFHVSYNCTNLLAKGQTYYDTVRVLIQHQDSEEIVFEYLVICDAAKLRQFDINFLVLFAIAIAIEVIAIKTPPLLIFNEMTDQEQEQTDLKLSSAVMFFVMSSVMLLVLYLFLEQIREVFTLLILISCIGCSSIIIEDFLLQSVSNNTWFKKELKLPLIRVCTFASIIGCIIGLAISITWYFTHNWILNNTLAILLSLTFLKTLRLTTLVPGMTLLGLLFFYDIFWVFLSPYFTTGG